MRLVINACSVLVMWCLSGVLSVFEIIANK